MYFCTSKPSKSSRTAGYSAAAPATAAAAAAQIAPPALRQYLYLRTSKASKLKHLRPARRRCKKPRGVSICTFAPVKQVNRAPGAAAAQRAPRAPQRLSCGARAAPCCLAPRTHPTCSMNLDILVPRLRYFSTSKCEPIWASFARAAPCCLAPRTHPTWFVVRTLTSTN